MNPSIAETSRFRWYRFFVFAAPVLGWFSFLAMMSTAFWTVFQPSLRPQGDALRLLRMAMWPIGLYLLVIFLGQLWSGLDGRGWEMAQYLVPLLLPLCLCGLFQHWVWDTHHVAAWSRVGVWVTVLATAAEFAVYTWVLGVEGHRARVFSANPLFVSMMLVPMMFLSFLDLPQANKIQRWLALATFLSGLLALAVFLGARGSLLIALSMLPLTVWYASRAVILTRRHLRWVAISFLLLVLTLLFAINQLSPEFLHRLTEVFRFLLQPDTKQLAIQDISMYLRWVNWQAAWQAISESLWTGHGFLNEDNILFERLLDKSWAITSSHQQYLSFAVASGLPGLFAGINFMLLPAWLLLNGERSDARVFAALSLCLPVMLNGFIDTTFDDLRILSYFVVLSLALASVRFDQPTGHAKS